MEYFIKIWPDNTAILVTDHGNTVTVFDSLEEAQRELRSLVSKKDCYDINTATYSQEVARSAA